MYVCITFDGGSLTFVVSEAGLEQHERPVLRASCEEEVLNVTKVLWSH